MAIQFPGRVNYMDPSRVEQSAQRTEWNALRNQGERDRQEMVAETYDKENHISSMKWLAAATKLGMDMDVQTARRNWPKFAQEWERHGLPADGLPDPMSLSDEDFMQGFSNLHQEALIGLAGHEQKKDTSIPAKIQQAEWWLKATPDQRAGYMSANYAGSVQDIGGVPHWVMPGGDKLALSTIEDEASGEAEIAGAVATAQGEARVDADRQMFLNKLEIEDERAYQEGLSMIAGGINDAQLAISNIDQAIGSVNWWSTGTPGQIMQNLGGTDARALRAKLEPVLAALAFDRLQAMRDASKTGGALGQVSERELGLLMRSRYAIDQATDGETLVNALMQARGHYQRVLELHQAQMLLNTGEAVYAATPAEARALPAGTRFVTPDGEVRTKRE